MILKISFKLIAVQIINIKIMFHKNDRLRILIIMLRFIIMTHTKYDSIFYHNINSHYLQMCIQKKNMMNDCS